MGQNIQLLSGKRFDDEANLIYKVPVNQLPKREMLNQRTGEVEQVIDFENEDVWKMIVEFIKHHRAKQVPRLQELKRYMLGDNNINYRPNKPEAQIGQSYSKWLCRFYRLI